MVFSQSVFVVSHLPKLRLESSAMHWSSLVVRLHLTLALPFGEGFCLLCGVVSVFVISPMLSFKGLWFLRFPASCMR
ncbi:hypothetical protein AALP_AAs74346U000100 [Arabis alpina]|uniref:Uncharacterized protein n=1 Tax=Arabis alpina TaxID=50452 RepID=A0A087FXJ6_ARAAL|nr:hypothetical protein AALP_AAs74346U000100 [Arabis alpina]